MKHFVQKRAKRATMPELVRLYAHRYVRDYVSDNMYAHRYSVDNMYAHRYSLGVQTNGRRGNNNVPG